MQKRAIEQVRQRLWTNDSTAPKLDEELAKRIITAPRSVKSALLHWGTAVLELESYDAVGNTLVLPGHPTSFPMQTLVPWGTVLGISSLRSAAEPQRDTLEG